MADLIKTNRLWPGGKLNFIEISGSDKNVSIDNE